jgi:hypothetical protein
LQHDTSFNYLSNKTKRTYKEQKQYEKHIKFNELSARKKQLEYNLYKDSILLTRHLYHEDPTDSLNRFIKKQPYKNLVKTLLAIKSFQVGISTPHYSDITFSQQPLYGIHTDIHFKHWFVTTSIGNRVSSPISLSNRLMMQPQFNNRTYAGQLGIYGLNPKTKMYVSYFHFENEQSPFHYNQSKNDIIGMGFNSQLTEWLLIEGELNKSFLQQNVVQKSVADKYTLSNAYNKDFDNMAYKILVTTKVTNTTSISGGTKRIGGGYYSLGTPYLRNDLVEYNINWKQHYWNRQIESELSFMYNYDNLNGFKTNTTILQGYGASIRTHLRKKPNLFISYKPFNSTYSIEENIYSNNQFIPTFISQQFYVIHGNVYFASSKQKNTAMLNRIYSLSYNRSYNQQSNNSTYLLQTYSLNATLAYNTTKSITLNSSLYQSSIVNNNAFSTDINASSYIYKQKIRFTLGGLTQWIRDGKQRHGIYNQISCSVHQLNISARMNLNYLHGDWYVSNNQIEQIYSIVLGYRF